MASASATHIGGKPRNEDTSFYRRLPDGSLYIGVFDGHGEYGLEIAEAVRDFFVLTEPRADQTSDFTLAETIARATILTRATAAGRTPIAAADGSLLHAGNLLRGGTTASLVHVAGDHLRHHHVGDSEVMVIHVPSREFNVLTHDHSSTCVAEYERIRREAKIIPIIEFAFMPPYYSRNVFVPDGTSWKINPLGGVRTCNMRKEWSAYLRGKMPYGSAEGEGLNMTRAIGDFSLKKHGVCARPDTIEHTLRPGRNIIVTASDGLYDNYTYEGLRDMVLDEFAKADGNVEIATKGVLATGIATGFKNFGAKGQDNTTVVLTVVDIPGAGLGPSESDGTTSPDSPGTPKTVSPPEPTEA